MIKRKRKRKYPLPSGEPGVYRADDGKLWEAYVADDDDLVLLGAYPTVRAAVAVRAKYWSGAKSGRKT